MSPPVKGTSGADALCIEGVAGCGGGRCLWFSHGRPSLHVQVAEAAMPCLCRSRLLMRTDHVRRQPFVQRLISGGFCCFSTALVESGVGVGVGVVGVQGEEQWPDTACAEQNRRSNTTIQQPVADASVWSQTLPPTPQPLSTFVEKEHDGSQHNKTQNSSLFEPQTQESMLYLLLCGIQNCLPP